MKRTLIFVSLALLLAACGDSGEAPDAAPSNQPPVVQLTVTPVEGTAPLRFTMTATANDPEGDYLSYLWDVTGTKHQGGNTFAFTLGAAGTYPVSVVVNDGEHMVSDSTSVTVLPPPTPPGNPAPPSAPSPPEAPEPPEDPAPDPPDEPTPPEDPELEPPSAPEEPEDPEDYGLEYWVRSDCGEVFVTYANVDGGTQQGYYGNGWVYRAWGDLDGIFLYVSAQNQCDYGDVTVRIKKFGKTWRESSSSGAYVIATASGSY